MSAEMQPYVVRQGDYFIKLAFVHGFDAEKVWNDPKNEDLRSVRSDPNILAPGDILYIPAKPKEGLTLVKGTTNRYRSKVPKISLTIVMSQDGVPLKNEPYLLFGLDAEGDEPKEGTTDADGKLTLSVPAWTAEVTVVFYQKGHLAFPILIGHMDPIESPSGWRKRLDHLGCYGWIDDPYRSDDTDVETRDREAILAFQSEQGLTCTGVMDEQTREALVIAHGC